MPLFTEIDTDPAFQAALTQGGTVPLQNGVSATYLPPGGNTGISGYGFPTGVPTPPVDPTSTTRSTQPMPMTSGAPAPNAAPPPAASTPQTLAPIQGFDTTKLQNPGYVDDKYTAALRAFSGYLGSGGQVSRDNLGGAVSYAQANGFPGAKVVGDDKIDFGDGRGPIDVITSNGQVWFANTGGQGQPGYTPPAATAGASAAPAGAPAAAGGAAAARPSVLTTPQFAPFQYQNYTAPAPFTAPTLAEAQNDPGYQFGLTQGEQAMQNSAAAQGLARTGGTLKDLNNYANDYATTKYNDVYNRALNTYTTNTGIGFQANQANNAGNLGAFTANTNAALGFGNLNNQATSIANSYALGQGQLGLGYYSAGNQYALGVGGLQNQAASIANNYALGQGQLGLGYYNSTNANALNWANYGLGANQQSFYQNYAFPIGVGLDATGQLNGAAGQYNTIGSNLITGAGNAAAAGTVGSANAYSGAANTAGNLGLIWGLYGQPPGTTMTPAYPGNQGGG